MSTYPYINPRSQNQLSVPYSVPQGYTNGTHFSIYGVGGYMEVHYLSDLYISAGTIPLNLNYDPSGNTILILNSDNVSSGRRKLGMLAYVYETDSIYQYYIPNYDTAFNTATGSSGYQKRYTILGDYETYVYPNSATTLLISGWTGDTIEGVGGATSATARWRKLSFSGGSSSGGTLSGDYLPLSGGTVTGNTVFTLGLTATTISATTYLNLPSSSGGTGSTFQYFITGSTPSGTIYNGDRWFNTTTGVELVYLNDGDSTQWVEPNPGNILDVYVTGGTYSSGTATFYNNSGGTFNVTGFTTPFTGNTSATCINSIYVTNVYGCSPINFKDLIIAQSGLTTSLLTATTINNTYLDTYYVRDNTGTVALDVSNRQLKKSNGSTIILDWENGIMSGMTSISTSTLSSPTFTGDSLTLSNSASTIYLNNTTAQQIKFYDGGRGTPRYNSYSDGAKIIFSDNISSISAGYAIGVDTGSLWYGVDLTGNGHDWYTGTLKRASLYGAGGFQLFGLGSPTSAAFSISGTSSLGSKGGLGYMDFLRVYNNYPSATNSNKWFRTTSGGTLQILRDDYNAIIFDLTDGGIMSVGGGNIATATSQDATSNYLSFNSNNTQIYDDGNTHIHSRGVGQSMWINTNGGQLNLLTQSPTATGSIGSGIAIATGTLNGYVTINTGRTVTTAASYGYLTTGGAGTYPGGSQSISISLYANNRIWGQEIDAFSDERMKNIEGEISLDEGIKLVNNLKPIKYTWKEGDDKGIKAGYSAQQVIKSGFNHLIGVIPKEGLEETVDEDGFTSPKDTQFSMNYDQVTPYHGIVIKHLLDEIENLKKEINELKNKVG